MELFGMTLGRKRPVDARLAADRVRQQHAPGRIEIVTAEEQLATRQWMEAELDAQRARRVQAAPPQA
jgi:hypothetical protein